MESAKNPQERQYSCFLSSYSTLSRIDMALGSREVLQLVRNIEYGPRGVSDHSPLVLALDIGGKTYLREWKISPWWLELIGNSEEVLLKL